MPFANERLCYMVNVEIIYIKGSEIEHLKFEMPCGSTAYNLLNLSGLLEKHPEITQLPLGIYSKRIHLNTVLKNGDRVEIYCPLLIDPKQKRRERAKN